MSHPQYPHNAFAGQMPNMRSSSSSSSLTGAMGDTPLSSRSPRPLPSRSNEFYVNNWSGSPQIQAQEVLHPLQNMSYPTAGDASFSPTADRLPYSDLSLTTLRNVSPELSTLRPGLGGHSVSPYLSTEPSSSSPGSSGDRLRAEIQHLRRHVQELEAKLTQSRTALENIHRSGSGGGVPPTRPQSWAFHASWKARTDARKRIFCSLNRAGNALCAWHNPRRERRAFAPRNAPVGYLNCGCTHEEALFEESLARHGIGSYHPGEVVRMDPALRNPLLKLLQERYGYQDGDFERDPVTGEWVEGEGAAFWENQAQSGSSSRKLPTDADRY